MKTIIVLVAQVEALDGKANTERSAHKEAHQAGHANQPGFDGTSLLLDSIIAV